MNAAVLTPMLTMADVYGPGHVFVPRAHDATGAWISTDPVALDSLTGAQLAIAGEMPVVCSAGVATATSLELLEMAGLRPTSRRIVYRAGEDAEAVARTAAASPASRLVVQHVFPKGSSEGERCWVPPELLSHLNNKANLDALAGADHVPERRLVERSSLVGAARPRLPVVIKLVSECSSGGGAGVVVCRTHADLRGAADRFANSESVVAEAMLDIVRNPCLNFAIIGPDDVRYIGFADQDVGPDGVFRGNWMDLEEQLPDAVVEPALAVARRAARMGYRGFAGIDMAVSRDGGIFVLDLNFRLNASTPAILLSPAIRERSGARMLHARKLADDRGAAHLADTLAPMVEDRRVVPVSLFDPHAAGYHGRPAIAQLLVFGDTRAEILATETALADKGAEPRLPVLAAADAAVMAGH